ncbi:hypothetical protein [Nocardia sp.]|uniref:hypothetical protein n=1 Tax=Nocardia sp. TaxID=1821 RepID=UPI002630259E|nr:hypothetical protein [Nocardia sp.]
MSVDTPLVLSDRGLHTLTADPRPLLAAVAPGSRLVGVGPGGVLVGAVLAALSRRDFAFYRRQRKGHGTRQHIEGRHGGGQWTVVHCGATDPDLLRAAGMDVVAEIRVTREEGTGAAGFILPEPECAPAEPVSLADSVELLTGSEFVRSSGERVDHYFETLAAAHTYDVAALFADTLGGRPDLVAGVMWGGCYLAAVAATRRGAQLTLVDPDGLDPAAALGPGIGSVAFLDDLVNSGTDFRRCERLAAHTGARATFHALYSPHARADVDRHPVAIGHRLVRS